MKITYVINSSTYGGMENHVIDLVEGMIIKGHEVFVWCPPGVIVRDFERVGAKVIQKMIQFDIDPFYICRLKKFLKKNKIDLVHAHELKAAANGILAAYFAGVKTRIAHTHTPISEWQISSLKKKINLAIYPKFINKFATYEIALTESRKQIKIKEGIKEDKLFIVESPNCIKLGDFILEEPVKKEYSQEILIRHALDEDTKIWGCLGRITQEKGHEILIKGFHEFFKQLPDQEKDKHHLIVTGGGPLEDELASQISELGLTEKITITGKVPHVDVPKYYSTYDVFIHPSLAEGFGIVLIEAMATGIPVIASDLEVFGEVAGDTVNYFETGNFESLAEVMKKVDVGGEDIQQKAEVARQRVQDRYSFERFIDQYNKFYLELHQK